MKTKYEIFEQAIENIHSLSEPEYAPLGHSAEELEKILGSIAEEVGEALPIIAAAPGLLEALRFLAEWTMRDGTPCFCPVGRDEDEPKGRMPTAHSTACASARAALKKAEGLS